MSTTATAEVSAIESAIRNFDEADNAIMGLPRNRRDPTLVSLLQAWRENRNAVEERLERVRLRAGEDGTDIPREVREEPAPAAEVPEPVKGQESGEGGEGEVDAPDGESEMELRGRSDDEAEAEAAATDTETTEPVDPAPAVA